MVFSRILNLFVGPKPKGGCAIFFYYLVILILCPLWVGILPLFLLFPLAFVFGKIEHHVKVLWLILVLFIQIGGICDSVADLILLVQTSLAYSKSDTGEFEDDNEDITERIFMILRISITFCGSFIAFITVLKRSGGKESGSSTTFSGIPKFLLLLMAAVYKLFIIFIRFRLVSMVIRLFTKPKEKEQSEKQIQGMESMLFLEYVYVSLPLGVLTLVQLIGFEKDVELSMEFFFELFKISALFVDSFGMSYFMYYVLIFDSSHNHNHTTQKGNTTTTTTTNQPQKPKSTTPSATLQTTKTTNNKTVSEKSPLINVTNPAPTSKNIANKKLEV
eukprot:gene5210-6488_t